MPIDYDKLMAWAIPDVHQTYTLRDTLFYALSVGMGADALDESQLRYVYERNLCVLPSMATVLASPSGWMRDPGTGINPVGTLAGDVEFDIHAPIPPAGSVFAKSRVTEVLDLGPDRGAMIYTERTVFDADTHKRLFCVRQSSLSRRDGGFGGPSGPRRARQEMPQRDPDFVCDLPAADNLPLLFRLQTRLDPHHQDAHADPALARSLGQRRPVLHGLCSVGMACHAILRSVCAYEGSHIRSMGVRFSALAYPGGTFRTEIWREGDMLSFQCRSEGSDKVVLGNGRVVLAAMNPDPSPETQPGVHS